MAYCMIPISLLMPSIEAPPETPVGLNRLN